LLAGLRGEANGAGGVIRIFDLFDYVQPRVVADRPDQHPIFKAEIEENFPVALYRGGQKAATTAPSASGDGYRYDVFFSYSGTTADRTWVRSRLLPLLEAQQLRVAVGFSRATRRAQDHFHRAGGAAKPLHCTNLDGRLSG
jgi:hypothetical protein